MDVPTVQLDGELAPERDIYIYASELAAATGHNRWKTVDEVVREVYARAWKRPLAKEVIELPPPVAELVAKAVEVSDEQSHAYEFAAMQDVPAEHRAAVASYVATERGTRHEAADLASANPDAKRRARPYKKLLCRYRCPSGREGNCYLFGRIDGIRPDGTVVETKHRRKMLFDCVPRYERIQLEAYLYLTGTERGVHTQCYAGQHETTEIDHDPELWSQVHYGLRIFLGDLCRYAIGR